MLEDVSLRRFLKVVKALDLKDNEIMRECLFPTCTDLGAVKAR